MILLASIIRSYGRDFWCGAKRVKQPGKLIRMDIFIFNSRTNINRKLHGGNPIYIAFYHGDPLNKMLKPLSGKGFN